MRSTCTNLNGVFVSWRTIATRLVHVDIGLPKRVRTMVGMSAGEEGECRDEWILSPPPSLASTYKYGLSLKSSLDLPHELALLITKLSDFV
jgi:hypothetical protein